jgi:curli biogenesis system outer membrane secretion channel CsgG
MRFFKILFVSMITLVIVLSPLYGQMKKRVAVFTFEDKTDQSYHWWDGRNPGDGMADMLTTALVKSGKYTVIERQQIASLLSEQQLGQSGIVTQQSAAKIGQMLGVDLAVIGAVTEFGHSKKDMGIKIKGFGFGTAKQKATVAVDVRLVNTSTGEIITAENVRKEDSSSGIKVSTPDGRFDNANQFDNSIVGKATRAAIEDIVQIIDSKATDLPWEGKIIKVDGSTIYIKPGQDGGVKVGDTFMIYHAGEALIDPDTGLSLGSEEKKIGSIEVTSVMEQASKATVRMGSGFSVGDFVRIK